MTRKWGKNRNKSQRYQCKDCNETFTSEKRQKHFVEFKDWIIHGVSLEYLSSGVSEKTLKRYFEEYLRHPPKPQKTSDTTQIYLKLDAQYLSSDTCIIIGKKSNEIIYWRSFDRETFMNYVIVLSEIKELGYEILGVTSDWHGSLVSAVMWILPDIPHQRCLVHTKRRCDSLLTRNPETVAGRELKEVVRELSKISSKYESEIWLKWLGRWEERHSDSIKQRSYGKKDNGKNTWWYTHKNLRATFRTLKFSIDHLFLYLDYEGLDKDTNGIESEFSHLKQKISMHRGLKMTRKLGAIYWYFHLVNQRRN